MSVGRLPLKKSDGKNSEGDIRGKVAKESYYQIQLKDPTLNKNMSHYCSMNLAFLQPRHIRALLD